MLKTSLQLIPKNFKSRERTEYGVVLVTKFEHQIHDYTV